jgi:hydrogenase maturation protein HypF
MAGKQGENGYRVVVRGIVQGVGFRPFVFREAKGHGLCGMVWNEDGEVVILAAGAGFDAFIASIRENNPPGSWVESVEIAPAVVEQQDFTVAKSVGGGVEMPRFFPVDAALCDDCLAEINAPADRRAGHYFNNCITCGPRFSVLCAFPYDRPNTTMRDFELCEDCRAEYENIADKRYHAETICCHKCGPVLRYRRGGVDFTGETAFAEALRDLAGGIAIKGIGGYHLACDPRDEAACEKLRQLKGRDSKPFALMFRDMAAIREACEVSREEEKLLLSPARPIVLLKPREGGGRVGAFLPYTALQVMLLAHLPCLVLTSANLSASPIITSEGEIFKLTDRVLYHNREILRGIEDSVVQVAAKPQIIRRGRGYVPLSVKVDNPQGVQLLAIGGDLKASFGLLKRDALILSHPGGDLEDEAAAAQFERSIRDYESLLAATPTAIVCDAHRGYFSAQLAQELATARGIPLIEVYHHHAHIASVMAEHGLMRVLGLAMDGTGYGSDGNIWGGEFLVCEGADCRRAGHLAYSKMLGADSAATNAAKTAECYKHAFSISNSTLLLASQAVAGWPSLRSPASPGSTCVDLPQVEFEIVRAALDANIGTFTTSSMGRLFDGVASLLGICHANSYEGECAMSLQYAAENEEREGVPPPEMDFAVAFEDGMYICDFRDIIEKCAASSQRGAALGFHNAVVRMICAVCARVCDAENIRDIALSGGVFQNTFLLVKVTARLGEMGYNVYTNEKVPLNDGGLAVGHAYIGVRECV